MNPKKSSFINKVIFFVLNKIFSKCYKSLLSRKLYKGFFGLLQERSDRIFSTEKPCSNSQKIISKLNRKGWINVIDEDLTNNLKDLKEQSIQAGLDIFNQHFDLNPTGKSYLKGVDLSKYPDQVKLFNQFLTHPSFVYPIAKYLGELPLLSELKLLYSPPTSLEQYSGSQLFHSDFDDSKLVKIFVFLEDIDEEMGPTEIIEKQETSLIIKKTRYKWGVKRKKYSSHDDGLKDVLNKGAKHISLIGPRGSTFLIDTVSCLHRGSRNPKKGRKILYANFTTRTSFRNPPLNWIINNDLTLKKSSPLVRLDPYGELNLNLIKNS
jgi:hypothetical protein